MIYRLTEEWAIRPIAEMMLRRAEVFKIPTNKLIQYLLKGVKDTNSVIIVDEKDKDVRGFLFASIEEFNGEDVCFIQSCVIEPRTGNGEKDPELLNCGHEMIEKLRKWCVQKGIVGEGKMLISADLDKVDLYKRRYKFKPHAMIMTRDILTDGQKEEMRNERILQKQAGHSRLQTAGRI
jgi:hypothetical protein